MRMHPRRHGAYNFSARLASTIVNAHYKKKKVPNGSGCLVYVLFVFIFIVFIIHMII